jgi:hypothetical protein
LTEFSGSGLRIYTQQGSLFYLAGNFPAQNETRNLVSFGGKKFSAKNLPAKMKQRSLFQSAPKSTFPPK